MNIGFVAHVLVLFEHFFMKFFTSYITSMSLF